MLKGAQKKMVMLRTADSSIFEAAYFILRDDADAPAKGKQPTMLEEANRILNQSFTSRSTAQKKQPGRLRAFLRRMLLFLLGFLLGAGLCILLVALLR